MSDKLFVYGTLKTGGGQEAMLGDVSRVAATTRGTLWDLPAGYPALGPGAAEVHGELVELPHPSALSVLDRFEGVDEGLYERVMIDVVSKGQTERAWAYVMERPRARGGRRIPGGRWRANRRR